jgi:hypothetical protein
MKTFACTKRPASFRPEALYQNGDYSNMGQSDPKKKQGVDGYAHIRISRRALQRLRYAIASKGGNFHGELQKEASIAVEEHANALLKKAKATADCPEIGRH